MNWQFRTKILYLIFLFSNPTLPLFYFQIQKLIFQTKKQEENDLWGQPDEEEDAKFDIEYNIKEKKVSEKDKVDTKVVESVWKEEDIVAIAEKIEENKPKEKKIMWGDSVKKNANLGQTVEGENYFPELGDENAE